MKLSVLSQIRRIYSLSGGMLGGCAVLIALLCLVPVQGMAQEPGDTVEVTANPDFGAGWLYRALWGTDYRNAWTVPIQVPVLDLTSFAGGLTPTKRGGGMQTVSLRLRGADGREYAFRSINKDPSKALPPALRGTLAEGVLLDQISSQHPAGAVMAAGILDAADILHSDPVIYVMPDSPTLGQFRDEFAGMLGMLEVRPDENESALAAFAGASRVTGSERLFKRVRKSPKHRVDAEAFLTARLIDIFLGDWDRHRDQWRWAEFADAPGKWFPIPRDRDQAFAKIDGIIPSQAKLFVPQLVGFGPSYPSVVHLHWNAREVDRYFLAGLPRSVWDSTARALAAAVTDSVIERAVRSMPAEMYALNGSWLVEALKARRDALPEVANEFYQLLAKNTEIHGTDEPEVVTITHGADGVVDITIAARSDPGTPYYHRRFDPRETSEVRLRLHGGDDRVVVNGTQKLPFAVRIIGGKGDDTLDFESDTKGVRFYDQYGTNGVIGVRRQPVNTRSFDTWEWSDDSHGQPQDWGHWTRPWFAAGASSDNGLLVAPGFSTTWYGFRRTPYKGHMALRAGLTTNLKVVGQFHLDYRFENSQYHTTFDAEVSGIDQVNFFGFGNNTVRDSANSFFEVDRNVVAMTPGIARAFGDIAGLSLKADLRMSDTDANTDHFIGTLPNLYGQGQFWQAGGKLTFDLDTRNAAGSLKIPQTGFALRAEGSVYPEVLDVTEGTFGSVDVFSAVYLKLPRHSTLALRGGGRKTWGTIPYFEGAYIGGRSDLRGWDADRFAGDASLFGGAELRLYLFDWKAGLPGALGVHGLVDAGRVWLDDETPGGWHTGYGGGLWFALLGPENLAVATVAKSDEGTRVYLGFDFAY